MEGAPAASPGRFLAHTVPTAEAAAAVNVAGIAAQWKRRRDVASPPARRAAGGATAPTTVAVHTAVHTPPRVRQRTVGFVISGDDVDAKLESFKNQVIAEFMKVHGDVDA